ncbi:TonB-dependent receptor [Blastomonas fulva]|uniref:TonB-dependent receptor n=1 Tax=Blastomonas fulva TaxID=1550728 RepID=UPI0025A431BD|nr:TonB-dependent receptor [Blastomonas fulva]MDM7929497.1 TonB-dependent receptor [Blastomonas fulva]MDM7965459.1 TonB-dependent receptor [Blastomonas fulva]
MKITHTRIKSILLSGAAIGTLALPGAALAQDVAQEDAEVDSSVIIVTASKREQTLQEVPISVSVTSGETIERAQIRDVLDLQTVVPSLRVSQLQTSSATTFIIRGFGNGDNNFGIEPSVGVFIDGVFRSRSASAISDLNLISRVEVLSGPQSTLFGKNASAGVISIVTKEPQYEFGGQVEASYGNFNAINLRGEVTGPITENIAFSLDGTYQKRDGFGRIVNLNNADINNRDRWSVRGNLLIEPTSDIKIRLIADYSKIDESCCQTSNVIVGPITAGAVGGIGGRFPTDFFSFDNFVNAVPFNRNENYGFSGQVDWSLGAFSLTSITAYRELTNAFTQDVDFTSADITAETRDQAVSTFTQELRIASDFDGPINFLLGGYYFDENITQDSNLTIGRDFRNFAAFQAAPAALVPPGATPAQRVAIGNAVLNNVEAGLGLPRNSILGGNFLTQERFALDNKSWSIFGTVDFEPVDGLVFTAGFNYTDDKKNFGINFDALDPLASINFVDAFITGATGGAVRTRQQFQALPAANQQALLAAATNPAINTLLPLGVLQFQTQSPDVPNVVEDGRTRDDKFTYLLRAAYQISDEINVYASYATGFKASSVNLSRDSRPLSTDFIPGPGPAGRGSSFAAPSSPLTNAGLNTPNLSTGTRFAGPEEAEVEEIGMKAQWDGFGVNLALFDQTIQGFQSFLFTGLGFGLANAGQQSVKGFELDTTVQPSEALVFTFAATYLDAKYDDFSTGPLGDLSGRRPGGIPEWSLRTSVTHTHEFGDSGTRLISRLDYSHESNVNILDGIAGFNANQFRREVNLVNGSMTLQLNNGIEVGAFARNLLDQQFILTVFPGVAQAGTVSGYPNAPRTFGGLVRFKF